MSKLEELIQQYCPDGVEYVKLGDIEDQGYIKLGRGNVISKQDMKDCPGDFPVYSSSSVGDGEIGRYGKYMFDDERISWSIDGGGKFFYRNNLRYSITNVSGWLKVLAPKVVSTKYLYYTLMNEWVKKVYDYTHKAHPSVIREEYIIPIPPLPVQEEIVRVLDTFTELQAELQAELQKRLQQYNYYKEEILTHFSPEQNAKEYKLGDICELGTGSHNTQDGLKEGSYPFYTRGIDVLYLNSYDFDETAIITAGDGAGVGKVFHYVKGKYALHQRAYRIVPIQSKVLARYLYYYLETEFYAYIMKSSVSSSVTSIRKPMLLDFPVLLPSLAEQQRIVDILDRFDSLTNDLTAGLPAEIEKRRYQYEYYRDKLLTFKRK